MGLPAAAGLSRTALWWGMKTAPIKRIELNMDELESILERAQTSPLDDKDCAKIKAVFESYLYLTELLEDKATTIDRLRKILFGSSSEKTREVIPQTPAAPPSTVPDGAEPTPPKGPGHGRHGADAYHGALVFSRLQWAEGVAGGVGR